MCKWPTDLVLFRQPDFIATFSYSGLLLASVNTRAGISNLTLCLQKFRALPEYSFRDYYDGDNICPHMKIKSE